MNSALKHTIIAMATAALSMTAACKDEAGPEAAEATAGAEEAAEASCGAKGEGSCGAEKAKDAAEGAAEGAKEGATEASCGEGSCG